MIILPQKMGIVTPKEHQVEPLIICRKIVYNINIIRFPLKGVLRVKGVLGAPRARAKRDSIWKPFWRARAVRPGPLSPPRTPFKGNCVIYDIHMIYIYIHGGFLKWGKSSIHRSVFLSKPSSYCDTPSYGNPHIYICIYICMLLHYIAIEVSIYIT